MDETLDSFLKEINEIAPPKNIWEECYDKKTGYTYYWNTETDQVTWDTPSGYKKSGKSENIKKKLYIPPPSEEKLILESIPQMNKCDVKIYKIDDRKESDLSSKTKHQNRAAKKKKEYPKKLCDSDEEKITLISSYGSESSSDEETSRNYDKDTNISKHVSQKEESPIPKDSPYNSDEEKDILFQIQNKANMLKQMGGEIPESVKKLVHSVEDDEVTGFSLVAGYGDDSEEETERKEQQKIVEESKPASTLFPILFNASQFLEDQSNEKTDNAEDNRNAKAFQRKRRIGVSLVNTQRKTVEQDKPIEVERAGFGLKPATSVEYPGFKSAGVLFTKSQEVPPPPPVKEDGYDNKNDDKLLNDIQEFHDTLDEKLKFLCEGHSPALPVHVMIIQMNTLYTAMKENCLKPSYLQKWLDNTYQDLAKLEEEAAPTGWLLQWDRTHKRYYYHNQTSGENQWEYPQPDIVSVDEAMDISTTPPPINEEQMVSSSMNLVLPPPPPQIREKSVSPPPPPVISEYQLKENLVTNSQPCPPGVDDVEIASIRESTSEPKLEKDNLASELNSFYSDIATIESVKPTSEHDSILTSDSPQLAESAPPKKKKKVKISQGLAMKKKGVSKLVEKWKNVQKTY